MDGEDTDETMSTRKASIKETGEELSQEEWARFDAAVAEEKRRQGHEARNERDQHAEASGGEGEPG